MSKKELVHVDAELPSYLQPVMGTGADDGYLEDEADILRPPRLKILQGLSSEVVNDGEKLGDWWSDYESRSLGPKCIVSPIKFVKEWIDFHEDNTVNWRTSDPHDPRVLEGENSWRCLTMNVLLRVEADAEGKSPMGPYLCVFGLRNTNLTEMREWYTFCKRKGKLYAQKYELASLLKSTKRGKHHTMRHRFMGYHDEETFKDLEEIAHSFSTKEIQPEYSEERVEAETEDAL